MKRQASAWVLIVRSSLFVLHFSFLPPFLALGASDGIRAEKPFDV
jgi:hypothetical protein